VRHKWQVALAVIALAILSYGLSRLVLRHRPDAGKLS
jgi:hypothetical protein